MTPVRPAPINGQSGIFAENQKPSIPAPVIPQSKRFGVERLTSSAPGSTPEMALFKFPKTCYRFSIKKYFYNVAKLDDEIGIAFTGNAFLDIRCGI